MGVRRAATASASTIETIGTLGVSTLGITATRGHIATRAFADTWTDASGGTVTTFTSTGQAGTVAGGLYRVHLFTASGFLTVNSIGPTDPINVIVVGSGGSNGNHGSSGNSCGGGGGAGEAKQYVASTSVITAPGAYYVTVGTAVGYGLSGNTGSQIAGVYCRPGVVGGSEASRNGNNGPCGSGGFMPDPNTPGGAIGTGGTGDVGGNGSTASSWGGYTGGGGGGMGGSAVNTHSGGSGLSIAWTAVAPLTVASGGNGAGGYGSGGGGGQGYGSGGSSGCVIIGYRIG